MFSGKAPQQKTIIDSKIIGAMNPQTRRQYLRTSCVAACGALAGCNTDILRKSEPVEIGQSQSRNKTSFTVEDISVNNSFLYSTQDGYWRPTPLQITKYAFIDVAVDGCNTPSLDDLQLVTQHNDERFVGTITPSSLSPDGVIFGRNSPYNPKEGLQRGWIAFEVDIFNNPPQDAYASWDGLRWEVDQIHREALAGGMPSFEYSEIEVPKQSSSGEPLDIHFRIRNISDVYDGVCRGALHILQPRLDSINPFESAIPFAVKVQAGDSSEWTYTFESEFTRSLSKAKLDLRSHAGNRAFSIDIG
jgi:hypothetical protein